MNEKTQQIGLAIHATPNTKIAATLLTLGFDFVDYKHPVQNTYDEKHPFKEGQPGVVTYLIQRENLAGVSAGDIETAYGEMTADQELDALVEEIAQAAPKLGRRLKRLLPLALASYIRGGLENRERILDLWRRARPMILVRKSATSFALVSRNASEATLRRCGIS